MTIETKNPATGQTLASLPSLSKEETMEALGQAETAFKSWKSVAISERASVLKRLSELLRRRQQKYALAITREMGKRISEARSEIEFCAEIVDYYADHGADFLSDQPVDHPDGESPAFTKLTPLGPILGIMPWNFPFYQVIRFAAPNLMAGNVVLLKHAATVAGCAAQIQELFDDAGFPSGVYINLPIPTDFVKAIIEDERVRGVSLTGSEAAGSAVASLAGKCIKPSVLELGGNDPFIVLADADLDLALDMAVKGRMVNAGQSCVASKRFIVHESLYGAFVDGLKERFAALSVGDPEDESTDLGPLSSSEALERLAEQVESAERGGATVETGGKRMDGDGAFFEATILTGVTADSPTFDQELFGPVATIYSVGEVDEAIALANRSSFGLGGSVFSRDQGKAARVAEQLEAGMVFVNQPTSSRAHLPFGGIKNSGYGRELSRMGILEFVNRKTIHPGEPS